MDISTLLALSVKHNASDLHLSANLPPMLRIDGELRKLEFETLSSQAVLHLTESMMTPEQSKQFQQVKEADWCYQNKNGRFRVNRFLQSNGYAAVMRYIPASVPSLQSLHAPDILERISGYRQGLVLVTGPTGSGKSTTLAAMVDEINRRDAKHILTIEDPVEFIHHSCKALIHHREVGRDSLSFADALRAALREDPDVLLIGELRDPETIRLALTAAETGHLILATLHTRSAAQSIDRIIDVFPADEQQRIRTLLAESLQAVVAQRLLVKDGGGRTACYEVLVATPAVRNLIRENKLPQIESVIQTGSASGMMTMMQDRQRLVNLGIRVQDDD
ncbi:type IV pilus twitching motility protein PilT [Vibrio mangrovi]|uniref:Twitching mobility protein n=1 Tax=Vibrio mangrovi TaxID=474394 RepID=A0A1Y6IXX7_9VIBR|nr:type IV pilus twitching motility protein PilT [Vibrio mangrovi]MDW6001924.1 type IV pilus twitching motility protein PilT [Vibrio mangrovi]SMS02529.1 Twitching mobility protein [Vibrio mangrovi]